MKIAGKTLLAATLLVAAQVNAQGPVLERIGQAGGQIGTQFELLCEGERLGSVNDVLFADPGLSLIDVQSDDDYSLKLKVEAAADVLPGEYPIRLISPGGISALRGLHLSLYPKIVETEPNQSVQDAQEISIGSTIHGIVDEGDVDVFRISLKKGERLAAEVVGVRNTVYLFDSRISISDASGKELVACDDCPLLKQDPMLSFVAPEDGDYFLLIREAAFGGDLDSVYQLHVGKHLRPTLAYPAGGQIGAEQTVTLLGDAGGPVVATIPIPDDDGIFDYFPKNEDGLAPSPLKLRASPWPNSLEVEPNDSMKQATPAMGSLPIALNGQIQSEGDIDYFRFKAQQGQAFDVTVYGHRIGSPIDSVVTVFDGDGRQIISNDDGANHDSRFRFYAPKTGSYVLAIRDHLNRGGEEFVYRIEFEPVSPDLDVTIPVLSERDAQQGLSLRLPAGGRMALLVSARRQNFQGDIQVSPDFLPDGVTATSCVIPNGSHMGYILFEAAKDAPVQTSLTGLNAVGDTTDGSVTGTLEQQVGLAFGPPRRTVYHSLKIDEVPLAVTKQSPFSIEVEQPQAPLARDGQLPLAVTVERNSFEGDVKLTLPILPDWVEAPEDGVTIPEGKDSVIFTLTANEEAEPQDWKLLMMAEGSVDGYPEFACSGEFTVTIADPLLDAELKRTVAQQGDRLKVTCAPDWTDFKFEGTATARLLGLPTDSEAPEVEVPVGAKSFEFPVTVGEETPASIHNTLFVEMIVPHEGTYIHHFLGRGGVLEVLEEGQKAQDPRSRLEILRDQKRKQSGSQSISAQVAR